MECLQVTSFTVRTCVGCDVIRHDWNCVGAVGLSIGSNGIEVRVQSPVEADLER